MHEEKIVEEGKSSVKGGGVKGIREKGREEREVQAFESEDM